MRRFHIYIGFIVWLLTSLFAVSCNDELEGNGYTPQLVKQPARAGTNRAQCERQGFQQQFL